MESGTTELALPGLERRPSTARSRTASAAAGSSAGPPGSSCSSRALPPRPRAEDRRPAQHRARRRQAEDVRERRDLRPLQGVDSRRRCLHRPDLPRPGDERLPLGAPDHDPGGEARLRQPDHGDHALVPLLPAGQEVRPARADHREALADVLDAAGTDRVLAMDLHAGQIQGFFRIPVDHMTALPLFARYYRETLGLHGEGVVAVSPDPGRAKMATKFAQMLDADFALMNKERPATTSPPSPRSSATCAGRSRS